jgi:ubiquinone/menaquinone biosynthesis C-methylase UbiE
VSVRQERWEKAADAYATGEHRSGRDLELVVDFADPAGYERVLDIGAGAGHTALALAPYVESVLVTDPVDGMLTAARGVLGKVGIRNAEFLVASAERLPFERASFEIVTSRLAAHHFDDVTRAFHEVARVLRHGGRFVLVDTLAPEGEESAHFQHEVELLRDPTHRRIYTREEWIAFCHDASLHVEKVDVVRKAHPFEDWLVRGGEDEATRQRVRDRFVNAPTSAVGDLGIVVADGRVTSFTDSKLVLRARQQLVVEHFSAPRPNLIESDLGFSVEVMGRTGIRYIEGDRSILVDSEVLAKHGIAVLSRSIRQWDPPHETDTLESADRSRVLENMRRAFEAQGDELQVS